MKRIYVSSNWMDMDFERELLWAYAQLKLKDRQVTFEDLRSGADYDVDEVALDRKLRSVNAHSIRSSNPCMVVFLGERYGVIDPETGISEVEKEINIALECKIPVLCYIREMDLSRMGNRTLEIYDAETPVHRLKMQELKDRMRRDYPDYVRTYQTVWDSSSDSMTGVQAAMDFLLADLIHLLDASSEKESATAWQEQLLMAGHTYFMQNRPEPHAESARSPLCCVHSICGEYGSGKTWQVCRAYQAVLAKQTEDSADVLVPLVFGAEGGVSDVDDALKVMLYLLETKLDLPVRETIPGESKRATNSLTERFLRLYKRYLTEAGGKFYLFVDNADSSFLRFLLSAETNFRDRLGNHPQAFVTLYEEFPQVTVAYRESVTMPAILPMQHNTHHWHIKAQNIRDVRDGLSPDPSVAAFDTIRNAAKKGDKDFVCRLMSVLALTRQPLTADQIREIYAHMHWRFSMLELRLAAKAVHELVEYYPGEDSWQLVDMPHLPHRIVVWSKECGMENLPEQLFAYYLSFPERSTFRTESLYTAFAGLDVGVISRCVIRYVQENGAGEVAGYTKAGYEASFFIDRQYDTLLSFLAANFVAQGAYDSFEGLITYLHCRNSDPDAVQRFIRACKKLESYLNRNADLPDGFRNRCLFSIYCKMAGEEISCCLYADAHNHLLRCRQLLSSGQISALVCNRYRKEALRLANRTMSRSLVREFSICDPEDYLSLGEGELPNDLVDYYQSVVLGGCCYEFAPFASDNEQEEMLSKGFGLCRQGFSDALTDKWIFGEDVMYFGMLTLHSEAVAEDYEYPLTEGLLADHRLQFGNSRAFSRLEIEYYFRRFRDYEKLPEDAQTEGEQNWLSEVSCRLAEQTYNRFGFAEDLMTMFEMLCARVDYLLRIDAPGVDVALNKLMAISRRVGIGVQTREERMVRYVALLSHLIQLCGRLGADRAGFIQGLFIRFLQGVGLLNEPSAAALTQTIVMKLLGMQDESFLQSAYQAGRSFYEMWEEQVDLYCPVSYSMVEAFLEEA